MWILIAVAVIIILSLCVWAAIWFNDWSDREADKNEKKKLDLQRALIAASDKNKKRVRR